MNVLLRLAAGSVALQISLVEKLEVRWYDSKLVR